MMNLDKLQFGFMAKKGTETIDALFGLKRMEEELCQKNKSQNSVNHFI